MTITVGHKPVIGPEKDVMIEYRTMELIKRVKRGCGFLDAVMVTREITGCSLLTAKIFVEELK